VHGLIHCALYREEKQELQNQIDVLTLSLEQTKATLAAVESKKKDLMQTVATQNVTISDLK